MANALARLNGKAINQIGFTCIDNNKHRVCINIPMLKY